MLPLFYIAAYERDQQEILLDEVSSRHIIQVLRMNSGQMVRLTDGKGHLVEAAIIDGHKKKCVVEVRRSQFQVRGGRSVTLAISLLKNVTRFEWLLEKATEIGIARIIPLICERTEKRHLRVDRMQQILISAMIQSQQTWLPDLTSPIDPDQVITSAGEARKFIAHCAAGVRSPLSRVDRDQMSSCLILIGPEGDFTEREIATAVHHGFEPVSLGSTRLRTETAGMVAAAILCAGCG
ncbi:MAG: RsmE family RNA methyltransferase [Bacteroidota bacterium]|nr:RsmE family RNA methyltransferase [Bacteroidota bacterium]MDP4215200.1 RsmE family RNA methyltransferase [Bacteroidota bacterium]MDP4244971.1 RsmE family RNA methyltransferase [Bacteroidota bacterium]MDP4255290.1 RsmE family RNA methyltransferase [Bacteroidota bacterium]MDP4256722.1 RsmE family RNA methyltransferase [Bacteroidota bacterium]